MLNPTRPGQAIGLAYTSIGGSALKIEAEKFPGNGHIQLTGHLGDVMKESVHNALSWIKANAHSLGIVHKRTIDVASEEEQDESHSSLLKDIDLHLNFPAAAIKKDGPSAGVTITSCLVSLFTCRRLRPDIAMTGEVSLHGEVLPVGGIKEKCIGALRNGVKKVILPVGNKEDTEELPEDIRKSLKIVFADRVETVLDYALEKHQDLEFMQSLRKPIFPEAKL